MFVIARHSTFAYKGKALDARRIADELGVRYLLEGSARRAAGRVRINVQLIDATGGGHLWAERFDGSLEDVFAVQDEVIAKIVEALVGRLTATPARNSPKSVEAYDLCVRARILHELSPQDAREGRLMLERAIDLDPGYAEAHAWLALNYHLGWAHWASRWIATGPCPWQRRKRRWRSIRTRPVATGSSARSSPTSGAGQESGSTVRDRLGGWTRATRIPGPYMSDMSVLAGRIEEGLGQIAKALRLNPYPPSWYFLLLGQAQSAAGSTTVLSKRCGGRKPIAPARSVPGREPGADWQLDEARRESQLFLATNPTSPSPIG